MPERCAECGVELPEGRTCQSIFEEFLSLEYTDMAYGRVHYLTVTCFMLQHGRYSNEAFTWARATLSSYLAGELPVQQLRQQAARGTDNTTRTWKILRQPGDPPQPKVAWAMTIADVAQNMQDAEQYCAQVECWARATLQQLENKQPE